MLVLPCTDDPDYHAKKREMILAYRRERESKGPVVDPKSGKRLVRDIETWRPTDE